MKMQASTGSGASKAVVGDGKHNTTWCSSHPSVHNRLKKHWNYRSKRCSIEKNGMWKYLTREMVVGMAMGLAGMLGFNEDSSIFAMGSGCGNDLYEIQQRWPKAHIGGIDFSMGGVKFTQKIMPNGTFCQSDMRSVDFVPTESYDFVWTIGVIFLITKVEQCGVIKSMVRIAKPGGTVAIADVLDPHHPVSCQYKVPAFGTHKFTKPAQVSSEELEECLGGQGFKIDYMNMIPASGGLYSGYCSGELSVAFITKI